MKKRFLFLILVALPLSFFGQVDLENEKMQVEIGYTLHFNTLNEDDYLQFHYPNAPEPNGALTGLSLEVSMPTKKSNIEWSIGTLFLINLDEVSSTSWSSGNTNSSCFIKNGGGVFLGLKPVFGSKHFGVSSEFALGVFSFKEYYGGFNNVNPPYYEYYEKKTSFGLGAMSSIGLYAKIGHVGIRPQVQAIFSGGNDASFMFYGFVFPLTIQF